MNTYSDFEEHVLELCNVVQKAVDGAVVSGDVLSDIEEKLEQVQLWFESDDPKANGQVGDNGLP